jgi:hypothetical protein
MSLQQIASGQSSPKRRRYSPEQKEQQRARASKLNALVTTEQRRERARKGYAARIAKLTPEQREVEMQKVMERMNKAIAAQTTEQRSGRMSQFNASLTPEERSERARRGAVALNAIQTPEQRSKNMTAYNAALTPDQRSKRGTKAALALHATLTPEQEREHGLKIWTSRTPEDQAQQIESLRAAHALIPLERKQEVARNNRLQAARTPNGLETDMISLWQELDIYAEDARTAEPGQVYYADAQAKKWYRRAPDGRFFIPDFKVKGFNIVFEIYGDFYHSREFNEPLGRPDYFWNAERKIALYADMGIVCHVYWEHELQDPIRREAIKREIAAIIPACRAQGPRQGQP